MKIILKLKPAILALAALALCEGQLNAELVLHWPFEEGSGTNTADLSGNSHTGVLTDMDPATDWVNTGLAAVPSGTAYALDFDGNNDIVNASIDNYKGVTGKQPRTVSAWIKTTAADPPIISWGQNLGGQKFVFRVQSSDGTNGALRVEVSSGYIVGALPINDGTWYHVAAVIPTNTALNVTQARLYVDGQLQGTSASLGQAINTASSANVRVGTRFTGVTYAGQIDEVRVYDHPLTPAELNALAGVTDAYADAVAADAPEGWWRLGEDFGARVVNEGSAMSYADGATANIAAADRYLPSLVNTSQNRALGFDGSSNRVTITSHAAINLGSYAQKTIESWFMPLAYSTNTPRRIIYEQGGGSNGFNQYLQRAGSNYFFRCGAWLKPGATVRGLYPQRAPVETGKVYHAVSVYSGARQLLAGYLNGACVNSTLNGNAGTVPAHTGGVSIGCLNDDTRMDDGAHDGSVMDSFAGVIDDVATYNNNLTFERIQEHYTAGSGDSLGLRTGVTRGVLVNYDAENDTDGDDMFEDSIGSLDTTATANVYDWALTDVQRVAVSDHMTELGHAYRFDGADTALMDSLQYIAGHSYTFSATVEMVFDPADFTGNECLLESGGTTTGMSLALNGSVLRLYVRYATSNNADVQFDLSELPGWQQFGFIHAVGVMDIDNDKIYLYVNGELRAEATASGSLAEWSGTDGAGMGCVNNAAASPVALSPFAGDIAIMRLYPSVLSADQIQANYFALGASSEAPGTLLMVH